MENIWHTKADMPYNTELMEESGEVTRSNTIQHTLTPQQVLDFQEKISHLQEGGHRCARVYRDAIKVNGIVYNICMSCGDILINGKIYSFSRGEHYITDLEQFKNIPL